MYRDVYSSTNVNIAHGDGERLAFAWCLPMVAGDVQTWVVTLPHECYAVRET